MRPTSKPIGLQLFTTSKAVRRAFDEALSAAGGSIPIWLVLTNLKSSSWRSQHDLAAAVGIEGPTLTRHLDGLEQLGLVHRRQDPENRRAVVVELTDEGHARHARLLEVVIGFDRRLRRGLTAEDVARLGALLAVLERNVSAD
jgi:MarR family transcriptional regulator, transcriptional regulator for hemolysin